MSKTINSKTTTEYTVIAIYGGKSEGMDAISSLDGTPGYLHVHIIRKDLLAALPTLKSTAVSKNQQAKTIYQWGTTMDKDLAIRKPLASIKDIIAYGNVGIGSAAIGGKEENSSFVGGGEVFIVPSLEGIKAFRVTKGQGLFPLELDDKCWTCEVTNNSEGLVIPLGKQEISSRAELLKILQQAHGQSEDLPFIAQFDASFKKEHLAVRSNGLWPSDIVDQRNITLFDAQQNDPVGGHLLGDSASEGDQLKKHKGTNPTSGAKVSLNLEGVLQITPIQNRLIALKDDPHQFRAPLLQGQLEAALQNKENHTPIAINGGGIAGVTTALKLAKLGIPCSIIDKGAKLLSETSGCTPARIGHGYHYRDLETAKLYLQSSITFLKEYCHDPETRARFIISVSKDQPELDYGLYFIRKDSQVPATELLQVYEGIRDEYKRLIELDPSNKIFGEVEDFFQILNLEDFRSIVDVSKMDAVIRTNERLLNWPEFSKNLLDQVEEYQQQGLISVVSGEEISRIEYDEKVKNSGFKISTKSGKNITASHVVNATWSNIEMLDETLFPEAGLEERTNRMKLIASISLPENAINIPSMFTAMGPFTMFSNEGNGKGKITFAPVTNMLDYIIEEFKKQDGSEIDLQLREIWQGWIDAKEVIIKNPSDPESWRNIEREISTPNLYKRWLAEGLNENEKSFFGKKILEGIIEAYPSLTESKVTGVAGGIVKSNGEVNIREPDSKFHERSDHGLKQRQIGYSDFNGVKLFYGESQSRCAVENIVSDIRLNHLIEKEVIESDAKDMQKEYMLNSYVRRYASERSLNNGNFSQLKSRAGSNVANQATMAYMQDALASMLNLYLKEPRLTLNLFTPFVGNVISSIGDATKALIHSTESSIYDEDKMEEQQQRIRKNLMNCGCPKLFTVFSIINSEGDIILDGKYGLINEEKRNQYEIPSLKSRDYVQEMMRNREDKFFCGTPVIGSTSQEFMIPIGITINEDTHLTFGMNVAELMRTILPKQTNMEIS